MNDKEYPYIRVCDCGKIITEDKKGKIIQIGMLKVNPESLQDRDGDIILILVKDCCSQIE